MSTRQPKSVSFFKSNEDDLKILKHVEGINFSAYVKDLIKEDMKRREKPLSIVKKTNEGGIKIVVGG